MNPVDEKILPLTYRRVPGKFEDVPMDTFATVPDVISTVPGTFDHCTLAGAGKFVIKEPSPIRYPCDITFPEIVTFPKTLDIP
jgi:hypothetical protein